MKPRYSEKHRFRCKLQLQAPLHIGSSDVSEETDAAILRDSKQNILLPGTSIAGVFRSRAEEYWGQENALVHRFFGSPPGKMKKDGLVSKMVFDDAFIENPGFQEIRDGVGINRQTLSARTGVKYDFEVVYANAELEVWFSVDLTDDEVDDFKKMISPVLDEFSQCIFIGGKASRGLGWGQLVVKDVYVFPFFRNKQSIIGYLTGTPEDTWQSYRSSPEDYLKQQVTSPSQNSHWWGSILIDLTLKTENEPFVVKSGLPKGQTECDVEFVTGKLYDSRANAFKDVEFIPGASIKGIFRARAEKILRTFDLKGIADPTDHEFVRELKKEVEKLKGKESSERAKNIHQLLGPVCGLFGSPYTKARVFFMDAFPVDGNPVLPERRKRFDHVAINRFTGGAMSKAKFESEVVYKTDFRCRIYLENPKLEELALIGHVLKDLYLGDLRFGYGKTKGYGKLRGEVQKVTIRYVGKTDNPAAKLLSESNLAGNAQQSPFVPSIKILEITPDKFEQTKKALQSLDDAFRNFLSPGGKES